MAYQVATACFFGALAGLAMGYGGRLAALWRVHADLLALAHRVLQQEQLPTAKLISEAREALQAVKQCESDQAELRTQLNKIRGALAQGEKPKAVRGEDLEFICAAVIAKLERRAARPPLPSKAATATDAG